MPIQKLDLVKELKEYYKAKKEPEVVDLGEGKYLVIEGRGSPKSVQRSANWRGSVYGKESSNNSIG